MTLGWFCSQSVLFGSISDIARCIAHRIDDCDGTVTSHRSLRFGTDIAIATSLAMARVVYDAALSKQVEHNQSRLANKRNTYSTLHIPTGRTAYAALAPTALVVSLSTLALSAMPVHRCTAMATQSSR